MTTAVIADIVGSRRLADRAQAQSVLEAAIVQVEREHPRARTPLAHTVGDELQGEYASLPDALSSLLLLQLALPDGIECRFGVGVGATSVVASAGGEILDGPGWWAARDAIETVHGLQQRRAPRARTWVVAGEGEDERMHAEVELANALLLARDELVGTMTEKVRRMTYGRCLGATQRTIAAREGVTQPAVSQSLATAGAPAVVAGFDALVRASAREASR